MAISFNQIPADQRLPLYYVEIDPSQAGGGQTDLYGLLVGIKLAAGTAPVDVPIAVSSQAQADALFGAGSMLARMVAAWFRKNRSTTLFCLPVAEPAAGVAATGTLTFTGPATAAGIVPLYIAGQLVQVGVAAGDTASQIATKAVAAIVAATTVPVTAAAAAGVVTVTCRWKGLTGNDIVLSYAYRGAAGGEALPAGVGLVASSMAGGVGAPDFTNAIGNLGDEPYEYVALPFGDTASRGVWEAEYGFGDAGRWGYIRQTYGHLFGAIRGTYSDLITAGSNDNAAALSVLPLETTYQASIWETAAAYAATAAGSLSIDPARPLQTLELDGLLPAPRQDRWSKLELSALAKAGWAPLGVSPNGNPQILRESTRYQKNTYGQPDAAYELVTTLATIAKLIRNQRQLITSKYPRHKLANDGTRFGAGQAIVTPKVIKAELLAQYARDVESGLVENIDAFKAALIVERNPSDPNRLDVLYAPDLVNGLRVFAVLHQFRLQYPVSTAAAA